MTSNQVTCSNCDKENDSEHTFCRHCGHPIIEPVKPSFFKHIYGRILSFFTLKRITRWAVFAGLVWAIIAGWRAFAFFVSPYNSAVGDFGNRVPTVFAEKVTLQANERYKASGGMGDDFVFEGYFHTTDSTGNYAVIFRSRALVVFEDHAELYLYNGFWWRRLKSYDYADLKFRPGEPNRVSISCRGKVCGFELDNDQWRLDPYVFDRTFVMGFGFTYGSVYVQDNFAEVSTDAVTYISEVKNYRYE